MATTVDKLLARARERLTEAAFRPPPREANLLLARVLGWNEARLLARGDHEVSAADQRRLEALVERRLTGEPVAYLLGEKEFYGRSFAVDNRVLIPRPETEHLVEWALELELPEGTTILDIGTGSGCLAVTLGLELTPARVVATDVSVAALAVAAKNAERHEVCRRLHLVAADLAGGLALGEIDLVVSNPPYVGLADADQLSPEIIGFEPAVALLADRDGHALHRRLIGELGGLRRGAFVLLEIGAGQEASLRRLIEGSVFDLLAIRPDYGGIPRVALLQRR
jgi:release factor glutamine methyltransferase